MISKDFSEQDVLDGFPICYIPADLPPVPLYGSGEPDLEDGHDEGADHPVMAFSTSAAVCVLAAVASYLRGRRYIPELEAVSASEVGEP